MVAKKTDKSETSAAGPTPGGSTRAKPTITGMTHHDLGLKVGVRYADRGDRAGFVPIIGWATVGNYIEAGTAALTPVVKGVGNQPTLASASTVKGYVGLFPIEAIVADIMAEPGKERPV